jgi:hypothetical protein
LVALGVAGAIAALAGPRLGAALMLLPGEAAVALIESGVRPGEAGLLRAVEAQIEAARIVPRSSPHLNAAYIALALADAAASSRAAQDEYRDVGRHHLERALALGPAQPRGWLMLAGLRLRDGDAAAAAAALQLSFTVDPHLPALGPFRWPLALRLGGLLDRETRQRANLEFLSYFRRDPRTAVRLAIRHDRLTELTALAGDAGRDRDRLTAVMRRLRYVGD